MIAGQKPGTRLVDINGERRMGGSGWERSSAWIWLYSSTQSTSERRPRYHTGILSGLRAIVELQGIVRCVLVCSGKRFDGIDVWPTDRLQQALAESTLCP